MPARDVMPARPARAGRGGRTDLLLQLGWPHFWLFSGILGGLLALFGLVFVAHTLTS